MARAGRKRKQVVQLHIGRPAGNGPVIIPAVVPDPFEPGKTLNVVKNARSSAIESLYARKRLGPPEVADARLAAAKRFNAIYERAAIGGAGAIDYSKPKVDVSFKCVDISDSTVAAIQELVLIRRALRRHYGIVEMTCGAGFSLDDLAAKIQGNHPSRRYKAALAKMLRYGLDSLAEHFGVARGPERTTITFDRDGLVGREDRKKNKFHVKL